MQKCVIIHNKARCKLCGDVIESHTAHDFVTCSCGSVSVDGGKSYLKRSFLSPDCYEDLSECEWVEAGQLNVASGPRYAP